MKTSDYLLRHAVFKLFAFLLLMALTYDLHCQKEGNIWYFGDRAGLDFNGGTPVALLDGEMSTLEGCASMSDHNGNLLFYTDGVNVWDASHNITPNGIGLLGDYSSSQSAIIVKNPDALNDSIFYIFTAPAWGSSLGLRYSIFNMNLNGGLGDVTNDKNILLAAPVAEKVTAVRHANGKDIWILTRRLQSNEWLAYLLDENGMDITPVVTSLGFNIAYDDFVGYMRASRDGRRVAVVHFISSVPAQIADFDAATGQFSNLLTLTTTYDSPYGIEFSPDSRLIYFSGENSNVISQFDLDATDVQASEVQMTLDNATSIGALQLGPDQKIYIAQPGQTFLSVINDPNQLGIACDLVADAVDLQGRICLGGLPNFFPDIFNLEIDVEDGCLGDSTCFSIAASSNVDTFIWDFGDPMSGAQNTSNLAESCHLYSAPGEYEVNLLYGSAGDFDTAMTTLVIDSFTVSLGMDTAICGGGEITLGSSLPAGSYTWQDGTMNQTLEVDQPGTYWVTGTLGSCIDSDTVVVEESEIVGDFEVLDVLCFGEETGEVMADFENLSELNFQWDNGENTANLSALGAGDLEVIVTNTVGCEEEYSVSIDQPEPLMLSYIVSDETCFGSEDGSISEISASGGTGPFLYSLDNGSFQSQSEILGLALGSYQISVQDANGCQEVEEFEVSSTAPLTIDAGVDREIIEGNSVQLDAQVTGATSVEVRWISGGSGSLSCIDCLDPVASPEMTTEYVVQVTDVINGCVSLDTIVIFVTILSEVYLPNVFSPNGDGINDLFAPQGEADLDFVYELQVFNRWGQLIYSSERVPLGSPTVGWDGKHKGEESAAGVYLYSIDYGPANGSLRRRVGDVSLVR